jgi:hypothetical protein
VNAFLKVAEQYHSWGANVNAISGSGKNPINKWEHLQTKRQTREELLSYRWGCAGGIGVINGVNGWRTYEFDAPKDKAGNITGVVADAEVDTLLAALGLPEDYAWVWRSGSGSGWEIAFICDEELPTGVLPAANRESGVFWGWPARDSSAPFHHVELRWSHNQTIYPPSSYTFGKGDNKGIAGPGYKWRGAAPTEPPAHVPVTRVIGGFFAVAPPPPHTLTSVPKEVKDTIKQRFDMVAYAQKHLGGDVQREGRNEVRLLGHGGLLLKPDDEVWYNHSDEIGGDCFDLVAYVKYKTPVANLNGKSDEILEEAAYYAGVSLPERTWQYSNVSEVTQHIPKGATNEEPPYTPATDVNDLLTMHIKPLKWFVPGFMREGFGLIVGAPQMGKTPLLVQLAISLATGTQWLEKIPVKQSRVLYIGTEYGIAEIQDTIRASIYGRTIERGWLEFRTLDDAPRPNTQEEAINYLRDEITRGGFEVIIIDTMTMFLPPEKYKQSQYRGDGREFGAYHLLAMEYHIHILGSWHGSKRECDPRLMYNGSTGLWASCGGARIVFYRDMEGQKRVFSAPRMKQESDVIVSECKDDRGHIWVAGDGPAQPTIPLSEMRVYTCLKENASNTRPLSQSTIIELTGLPDGTVKSALPRLAEKGLAVKVGRGLWYAVTKDAATSATSATFATFATFEGTEEKVAENCSTHNGLQPKFSAPESAEIQKVAKVAEDLVFASVPPSRRTVVRLYLRSNMDTDQLRARELCEEYGIDYETARKAVLVG